MIDFLKELSKLSGMKHVHIDPKLEGLAINYESNTRKIPEPMLKTFNPEGRIFGPFRRFALLPNLDQLNIIMTLRDPRDVLVSLFYARVYSHGPPPNPARRKIYLERAKKAKREGIDKFALGSAHNIEDIYNIYRNAHSKHDVLLLTYRELVLDFNSYLKKLLDRCGFPHLHKRLQRFNKFKPPAKENVFAHKRQVLPGDYRRKLQPPTINKLNKRFKPILNWINSAAHDHA
jgi:hypothetical protein